MPELILHHYDTSPFSEKIKKILAHKSAGVARGRAADDHAEAAADAADRRLPAHSGAADRRRRLLRQPAHRARDRAAASRADDLSRAAPRASATCSACGPTACSSGHGAGPVRADRRPRAEGVHRRPHQADGRPGQLRRRAEAGADGARAVPRPAPRCSPRSSPTAGRSCSATHFSLADAACYHPVWFLRSFPGAGDVVRRVPAAARLGRSHRRRWATASAATWSRPRRCASPRRARRRTAARRRPREPNGLRAGMRVAVVPDDYGFDPVDGEVVDVVGARDRRAAERPRGRRDRRPLSAHRLPRAANCVTGDQ